MKTKYITIGWLPIVLLFAVQTTYSQGNGKGNGPGGGNFWLLQGNTIGNTDFIGTTNDADFRIFTNGTQKMVVKSLGNVGVGVSSPTSKLEVFGNGSNAGLTESTLEVTEPGQAMYIDGNQIDTKFGDLFINNTSGRNVFVGNNASRLLVGGAGVGNAKVIIDHNSNTLNGHLKLYENDNDFARLVYRNTQGGQWHAAAMASSTPANAFYNIWYDDDLDGNGLNLLTVRGDGDVFIGKDAGSNIIIRNTIQNGLKFEEATGDKISLYGNRLGQTGMYGFGVESNTLYFKTNSRYRWYSGDNADGGNSSIMTLTSSGRLGVGTDNPAGELTVEGNDAALIIRDGAVNNSANAARIELQEFDDGNFGGGAYMHWNGENNRLFFGTRVNNVPTNTMVIDRSSNNVGIGTQNLDGANAAYRLAVNGNIRAKEIVVETGWSDFVFEKDYQLRSLEEVERFIKENGHLPEIPSAKEVEEQGVSLGEVGSKFLMKIEELTLYLIELKKENEALKQRLTILEN